MKPIKLLLMSASLFLAACTHAQIGKTTLDFARIDWNMNVPDFYATATDINAIENFNGIDPFGYFYKKETPDFYKTGEHDPCLVEYTMTSWADDDNYKEAEFAEFSLEALAMATTEADKLVMVRAEIPLKEWQVGQLLSALAEKYGGNPIRQDARDGSGVQIRRWETPTEYIQLELMSRDGKNMLTVEVPGDEDAPVTLGNAEPDILGTLFVWKKEYNDLVMIHHALGLRMLEEKNGESEGAKYDTAGGDQDE